MTADVALLRDVETAASNCSGTQRSEMLRRVTGLFIVGAPQYTDDQIALFDDVIVRLALEIEVPARALLAARLAPIPNAPPEIVRCLAFDNEIDVAGPILAQSERLDDLTLIDNASEMSQEHLFAISLRRRLSEAVTDVLVERGDRVVALSTISNSGAQFSEHGFAKLVDRSDGDDELAERVGARPEIRPQLFHRLLLTASQRVRAKLETEHPRAKQEVHRAVDEVAARISADFFAKQHRREDDKWASQFEQFDDEGLTKLSRTGQSGQVTAMLARRCELPISFVESVMNDDRAETLQVLLRAARLPWHVAKTVLLMRARHRGQSESDVARSLAAFERLTPQTAKQIVKFYRQRRLGPRAETD